MRDYGNRYLRDRMIERDMRRGRSSRRDSRDMRDMYAKENAFDLDYNYDSRRDYRDYTRDYRDYARDYANDYGEAKEEYEEDLEKWCKKLERKDRFKMPKEDVVRRAKQMGVKFDEYTEKEYMCVYYMLMSDYPNVANDPNVYLAMAKEFLEDDDIEVSPSEKLCIYMYKIVKGE